MSNLKKKIKLIDLYKNKLYNTRKQVVLIVMKNKSDHLFSEN